MIYYTNDVGIEMIKHDEFSNVSVLITDKCYVSKSMVNPIEVIDVSKINNELLGLSTKCNNIKLVDNYIMKTYYTSDSGLYLLSSNKNLFVKEQQDDVANIQLKVLHPHKLKNDLFTDWLEINPNNVIMINENRYVFNELCYCVTYNNLYTGEVLDTWVIEYNNCELEQYIVLSKALRNFELLGYDLCVNELKISNVIRMRS